MLSLGKARWRLHWICVLFLNSLWISNYLKIEGSKQNKQKGKWLYRWEIQKWNWLSIWFAQAFTVLSLRPLALILSALPSVWYCFLFGVTFLMVGGCRQSLEPHAVCSHPARTRKGMLCLSSAKKFLKKIVPGAPLWSDRLSHVPTPEPMSAARAIACIERPAVWQKNSATLLAQLSEAPLRSWNGASPAQV